MRFVPLLIFCIAIFIAFSSRTSWGTFANLVPIVVLADTSSALYEDHCGRLGERNLLSDTEIVCKASRLCGMPYPDCENPSIQVMSGINQSLNSVSSIT